MENGPLVDDLPAKKVRHSVAMDGVTNGYRVSRHTAHGTSRSARKSSALEGMISPLATNSIAIHPPFLVGGPGPPL